MLKQNTFVTFYKHRTVPSHEMDVEIYIQTPTKGVWNLTKRIKVKPPKRRLGGSSSLNLTKKIERGIGLTATVRRPR